MNSKVARTLVMAVLQTTAMAQSPWTLVSNSGPGTRAGHAMVFDNARGRSVLFGGAGVGSGRSDTWEWDGATWTLAATTGPARDSHAMAFDSARGRVVVFGGRSVPGSAVLPSDTWEWDGTAWALVSSAGPPPRHLAAMAFDTARAKTVLFGGLDSTSVPLGDTWEWNGTAWSLVATSGPPPRIRHAMVYDSVRGRTVLFGGDALFVGTLFGDTWEWDGNNWIAVTPLTSPSARCAHAMAFDACLGLTVMHGGEAIVSNNETWSWNGTQWTQTQLVGPGARQHHAMAFDSVRMRTVLFGGFTDVTNSTLGDTWELTNSVTPAVASLYGLGCGSPAPTLAPRAGSTPLLGQAQLSDITNAPFGFAAVAWGITSQSLPLDFVGATGCTLLNGAEMEIGSFCQSTSFSSAQHSLAIPYDGTLLGVHVYLQAWVLAPGFNPLGIAMSNGLELVIGDV